MFILENHINYDFTSNLFYVYEYWNNSVCFYVGKGRDDRYKRHVYYRNNQKMLRTNPHFFRKINQTIHDESLIIKIVFCGTEKECFDVEVSLIRRYGRRSDGSGTLTNINRGGEGNTQPGKSVCQYTKWGEYITTYPNAKEAARVNGWKYYSVICSCCRGRETSYKGYLWCYDGDTPTPLNCARPVFQWTLDGQFVRAYDNASSAAREMKCDQSTINDCVRGDIRQALGYLWNMDKNKPPVLRKNKRTRKVKHIGTNQLFETVTAAAAAFGHNVGDVSKCCRGERENIRGNRFAYV